MTQDTNTASWAADLTDTVCKAMRRTWQLGQIYWQQADSESFSQQKKSETTHAAFVALLDDTRAALESAAAPAQQPVAPTEKYDDTLLPFLALVRKELHANAGKGDRPGWLKMSADQALLEIYWHTAKLSAAVKNNDGAAIIEHSADVANMAMMLLDVCGGIPTTQAALSALEDAARYRHIRDVPHSEEVRTVLSLQQNAVMDKVIDKDRAAMAAKKGEAT